MKREDQIKMLVDEIGMLQAQMAPLAERLREHKDALAERGDGEYEGGLFRATVSTALREGLIAEKVREFLHPNQLRAATKITEVTSVRVVARKGVGVTTPAYEVRRAA